MCMCARVLYMCVHVKMCVTYLFSSFTSYAKLKRMVNKRQQQQTAQLATWQNACACTRA